jgi:hypothetical protein
VRAPRASRWSSGRSFGNVGGSSSIGSRSAIGRGAETSSGAGSGRGGTARGIGASRFGRNRGIEGSSSASRAVEIQIIAPAAAASSPAASEARSSASSAAFGIVPPAAGATARPSASAAPPATSPVEPTVSRMPEPLPPPAATTVAAVSRRASTVAAVAARIQATSATDGTAIGIHPALAKKTLAASTTARPHSVAAASVAGRPFTSAVAVATFRTPSSRSHEKPVVATRIGPPIQPDSWAHPNAIGTGQRAAFAIHPSPTAASSASRPSSPPKVAFPLGMRVPHSGQFPPGFRPRRS